MALLNWRKGESDSSKGRVARRSEQVAMKNKIITTPTECLLLLLVTSLAALTAENKARAASPSPSPVPKETVSPTPSAAKPSAKAASFHGMVAEVDQNAKTFTIAGKQKSRAFTVTAKTMITKSGRAANMADISENEEVSGSYSKKADGTLEAKTVMLGPLKKPEDATHKTEKSKKDEASATPAPKSSPKL
jgi:hypothetical protein